MVPKFRAFLTETKTMHDVLQIDLSRSMVSLKIENASEWYWFKEVVLMQSTGLKDKNGVEIFEGDVIFYAYFETNANNRLVKFVNGQFIAELIRNGYHKSLINVIDDAEIIGNIYEHPELLEVK